MQWQTVITAIGAIADLVSAATALILLIINQRGRGYRPAAARPSNRRVGPAAAQWPVPRRVRVGL